MRCVRAKSGSTAWLAALLCVGLLGGAVVAIRVLEDDTYLAQPATSPGPERNVAAAAGVLRDFEQAATAGDSRALAALAPSTDIEAQQLMRGVGANITNLDLREISARFVAETGAVAADGSWPAEVDLTWRLAEFDQQRASSPVSVRFYPEGAGVRMTFEPAERMPLWLTGRLSVVRSDGILVMASGSQATAREWLARTRRGLPVVRRVLADWDEPVVVAVPRSAAQLDAALGAPAGTYAQIAAVTSTADGSLGVKSPVRVFVNPEVTQQLRARGAQVVMDHELVHVATNALSTVITPWLLEGFADYVALRDVTVPIDEAAARAIAVASTKGVPATLPTSADLDTGADDLQAAYEFAWLACVVLAETVGEQALVDVYRAVDSGTPLKTALRQAGIDLAELTRLWRARIRGLL